MGDPRHQGKNYSTPSHPWQQDRMETESRLIGKYGLKNKRELWKAESELRKYRRKARELLAELGGAGATRAAAEREAEDLLAKLRRLGMLKEGQELDDVLGMDVRHLLDRRLQTVVYKRGLAKTPRQARQLVVHGHIAVDGVKVDVPSYFVARAEDNSVAYLESSTFTEDFKAGAEA